MESCYNIINNIMENEIKNNLSKTKKIILFVIIAIALAGIIGVVYYKYFYDSTLRVNVTPTDSIIRVNGEILTNNQATKFKPGTYHVAVSRVDYILYEKDIKLGASRSYNISVDLRKIPRLSEVVEEKLSFSVATEDHESILYLGNSGKTIYQINKILGDQNKELVAITPDVFSNISNIIWSHNRKLAIIKKGATQTLLYDFKRYDLIHQEIYDWGDDIRDIVWNSDDTKIIYFKTPQTGEKVLVQANKDNTNQEIIYNFKDTQIKNPKLYWSSDDKKLLVIDSQLYILDLYTKALRGITQEKPSEAMFTPDNTGIIYNGPSGLTYIDLEGNNRRELGVSSDLNKVAWFDNNTLFAAINNGKFDKFYKISISDGAKEEYIYYSDVSIKASNLIFLSDKKSLFFTSDNILYRLDLETIKY